MNREEYIEKIKNMIEDIDIKWLAIIYGMLVREKEKRE